VTSYRAYLASPEWDKRRKVEFTKAKGTCLACGNRAENIHHRTYERLGHEARGDLVALCKNCHLLAHLYHVEHADMGLWNATNALICQNRELFGLPPVELPERTVVKREARKAAATTTQPVRRKRKRSPAKEAKRQQRLARKAERHKTAVAAFFAAEGPAISVAAIEAARTSKGGWTRKQLAAWGAPWPPPKGWKEHLATRTTPKQGSENDAA
jgi:hypothetical protein